MKQRVLTAALLIPPVLLAVFLSNAFVLWALAILAFGICYVELRRLAGIKRATMPIFGLVPLLGWPAFVFERRSEIALVPPPWATPLLVVLLAAAGWIGAIAIARGARGYLIAEVSSLWIAAPLVSLVLLKLPASTATPWSFDFRTPVLLSLIPLWIGDTAAIFAGKAFGKHLLAPKISPKKTVEGGVANLLGCIGGAIGVAALIGQPIVVGALAGLATGVLGQAGDLLESAMKRSSGLKDSGTLLPGHGGLLDRIDSILLSAPVVALVVVMLGTR